MIDVLQTTLLVLTCLLSGSPAAPCVANHQPAVAGAQTETIVATGESIDVVTSAAAALVWDIKSGQILYSSNASEPRPVASLSKLLSALTLVDMLADDVVVTIPSEVRAVQRQGADIGLPVGQHARVDALLNAGLTASANDAMVTLAIAASGSEAAFVEAANQYAVSHGLSNTRVSNATGLTGGEQYSTANDVQQLLLAAYRQPRLSRYMVAGRGVLQTIEGSRLGYLSTNKLLNTYLPIVAAKTGYTVEAGENLVIITTGQDGQQIGAVILGSADRFQDMKTLVEWTWRKYTWK